MTQEPPIDVVAISGSLRRDSITFHATRAALAGAAAAGARTELIDLRDPQWQLPFCDARDEDECAHDPSVARLREKVKAAHGLILGTPEYHGSFSGVLKNALDLMSMEEMGGKMVGLVSVAGGESGKSALSHMRLVMRAVHAWVVPQEVMVPRAGKAFDAEGRVLDPKLAKRVAELGREVVRYARIHARGKAQEGGAA
ncbi:MAG TPA: NAD(P)H-dependent oxidoreductase [Planctomycetota bacterium]|nr:NAD(P)H-dependent oxidoreductase [Planctomycetota bacterium]